MNRLPLRRALGTKLRYLMPTFKVFDNLDKGWLIKFVEHRVADPRILRLIQKWLNAGVVEEGQWSDTKTGSPQGSVFTAPREYLPALLFRPLGGRGARNGCTATW
ncbi:MAG TPA: hypothetical protein VIX37_07945 [Candidatus Sulfotelmatobacter sp.]